MPNGDDMAAGCCGKPGIGAAMGCCWCIVGVIDGAPNGDDAAAVEKLKPVLICGATAALGAGDELAITAEKLKPVLIVGAAAAAGGAAAPVAAPNMNGCVLDGVGVALVNMNGEPDDASAAPGAASGELMSVAIGGSPNKRAIRGEAMC